MPIIVDDVMRLLGSIAEERKMKGGFKDAGSFIGGLLSGITGAIAGKPQRESQPRGCCNKGL